MKVVVKFFSKRRSKFAFKRKAFVLVDSLSKEDLCFFFQEWNVKEFIWLDGKDILNYIFQLGKVGDLVLIKSYKDHQEDVPFFIKHGIIPLIKSENKWICL